jgi:chemotaxis protein histidine kinase CheA/CheY-like chemotaxis protein
MTQRFDELATNLQFALSSDVASQSLMKVRSLIEDLRVELEGVGLARRSRAIARIGALTEVWECLSGSPNPAADEVGFFCVKAVSQLARSEGVPGANDELADWILDQSSSSWSDYLELIENQDANEPLDAAFEEAGAEALEDEPPAIDAQALLRLFQGVQASEVSPSEACPAPPTRPGCTPQVIPLHTSIARSKVSNISGPGQECPEPPDRPPAAIEDQATALVRIPPLPDRVDLDEEIREAFLADATDLYERIEPLVLGLGTCDNPRNALCDLARCLHTLKGAAGSVGLSDVAAFIHVLEGKLEGELGPASSPLIDLLFNTVGYLDGLLALVRGEKCECRTQETEPAAPEHPIESSGSDESDLPRSLVAPATAADAQGPLSAQSRILSDTLAPNNLHEVGTRTETRTETAGLTDGLIRISASRFDELMDMVSELIARRRLWTAQADSMKSTEVMLRTCRNRMINCLDLLHEQGLGRDRFPPGRKIHDDVPGQLRRLGELADDLLVLADSAQEALGPLADHGDALGRLTFQIWDELQAVRVVPIKGMFQRLVRVAHDAARVEGREVETVMIGEGTGVDRAVQDKAYEPLLHVVRNAVGHGIESPEEREAQGKSPIGRITLEARREGNVLVIAVQDDGRGLNHEAIASKARRLGLLGHDEQPSIDRLNNLIFHPGFSTRDQANAISGRGVGMDVVAREVSLLKGTTELQTTPGRGTRLTIRLPARLALETAMIVRVDGQAFAIPVAQIESAEALEHVCSGDSRTELDHSGRPSFVRHRDRRIPVIVARELLRLSRTPAPSWPRLLVIRPGNDLIGLIVDSIDGTEELVIKPLSALLAGHPVIAGTSLSTKGEFISILNLSKIRRVGNEIPARRAAEDRSAEVPMTAVSTVLVVDDSISVRRVVARQLRSLGLEVEEVSDGQEALGRLRNRSYDLVLTDLEMPRLDGFELVAEMKRNAVLATIPVIVASTRVDQVTRGRVRNLGAHAFLSKPVDPATLASVLGPLLPRATG